MISIDLSRVSKIALVAAMGGMGFAVPAAAADIPITFNFNNTTSTAFSNGMSAASITSYMQAFLSSQGFGNVGGVSFTGGVGQMGSGAYNGDNHIVGCIAADNGSINPGDCPGSSGVTPLTLGNTENSQANNHTSSVTAGSPPTTTYLYDSASFAANDGFIKNCTSAGDGSPGCSLNPKGLDNTTNSPDMFMNFAGLTYGGKAVTMADVSFDFMIYPDGSCPQLGSCGSGNSNLPDLELWTGDAYYNSSGQIVHGGTRIQVGTPLVNAEWNGVAPGSIGNTAQLNNTSANLNGTFSHSILSGTTGTELAPQLLSTSGLINLASNTTQIDFADWPATIGLDNVKFTFRTPEPSSSGLFGFGLLGLAWIGWRNRRRATRLIESVQKA